MAVESDIPRMNAGNQKRHPLILDALESCRVVGLVAFASTYSLDQNGIVASDASFARTATQAGSNDWART